jgi:hypothetical protein
VCLSLSAADPSLAGQTPQSQRQTRAGATHERVNWGPRAGRDAGRHKLCGWEYLHGAPAAGRGQQGCEPAGARHTAVEAPANQPGAHCCCYLLAVGGSSSSPLQELSPPASPLVLCRAARSHRGSPPPRVCCRAARRAPPATAQHSTAQHSTYLSSSDPVPAHG